MTESASLRLCRHGVPLLKRLFAAQLFYPSFYIPLCCCEREHRYNRYLMKPTDGKLMGQEKTPSRKYYPSSSLIAHAA